MRKKNFIVALLDCLFLFHGLTVDWVVECRPKTDNDFNANSRLNKQKIAPIKNGAPGK